MAQRDQLIADQENLLNTYRCLFGVDTGVVPGGCPKPDTISPGAAPHSPTQHDVDVRDRLIHNQEALLNVYRCRFAVDTEIVPGGCVDGEPAPATEAGWFPDPACRHEFRWWDGREWTDKVGDRGAEFTDPLAAPDASISPGEAVVCPGEPDPTPEATPVPTPVVPRLTAADLGCTGPDPACEVRDDGLACATRVVSHAELVASGGFDARTTINPYAPDVPEPVALTYLTACLREWDDFTPSRTGRYRFTASPVMACSVVWRDMAYAINHLGAGDIGCVWGSFERLWLRGGAYQERWAHSGWAETCPSWLDPQPDLAPQQACLDRDRSGYVADVSRNPQWEEWGLVEYRNYEWITETLCTWRAKCEALRAQVAPDANRGRWFNNCDHGAAGIAVHIIEIAREGRCGGLELLAQQALWAAGDAVMPHVAAIPGDQIIDC